MKQRKQAIMEVIHALHRRASSSSSVHQTSRYGVWVYLCYWCVEDKEHATYKLFFRWDEPLNQFKLHFIGHRSAYLNRKHALRELLEEVINSYLETVCKSPERNKLLTGN